MKKADEKTKAVKKNFYKKRKQTLTPVELAKLTREIYNFSIYGRKPQVTCGKLASKKLNVSELFGVYVSTALAGDIESLLAFSGKKTRGKQRSKTS